MVAWCGLYFSLPGAAQQTLSGNGNDLVPDQSTQNSASSVAFTLNWPSAEPQHYTVRVTSDGHAEYTSQASAPNDAIPTSDPANTASNSGSEEPFMTRFTVSDATSQVIFSLARQANFFNGNFNYDHHRIADTGTKTLAYADSARHYQTSYNWSENKAIDELTHIFEGIGSTIESGRRLEHLMRFDKLGLNQELSGMEQAAHTGQLRELQIIAPVLQQIASNSSYMNIARERARNLLQLASR